MSEVAGNTFLLEFLDTGQHKIIVNDFKCVFHKELKFPYEACRDNKCLQKQKINICYSHVGPPLWSSGQSSWLQIDRSWVRFPALPDFLSSSGSGTASTQPREPRQVN
jgi:hypothetical protein